MSTTMHAPGVPRRDTSRRTLHWLEAAIAVLAAALVGLVVWVLVGAFTGPVADTENLVDDTAAAWSSADRDALAAVYAPDALVTLANGSTYSGIDGISSMAQFTTALGASVERVAPVTVEGEYASTYVAIGNDTGGFDTVLTVFQIQDGKIVRQWDLLPGSTPPLTNVAP